MTDKKQFELNLCWLWSFYIRARDGFKCQLHDRDPLKCSGQPQAAHIITRGVKGLKFNIFNGKCLCSAHHKFFSHRPEFWAKKCVELWSGEWEELTAAKWQRPDFAIDKEEKFKELLALAALFIDKFPEYSPRLRAIAEWAKETGRIEQ